MGFYDCHINTGQMPEIFIPFLHPSREGISRGSIRAISGLRLPFLMMFFVIYLQKTVHFYILFQNTLFPWGSGQTGQYPSNYKTLMYANGRQNERWLDR